MLVAVFVALAACSAGNLSQDAPETVDPNSATNVPTYTPTATEIIPTETITPAPSPTETLAPPVTTLLFTGVIVPARCVQAGIDRAGNADYILENVRGIIQDADLAIGTLNATISDYPPRTGCIDTFVLTGQASNADMLAEAGFDVMSVATNHIKNCGPANCGDRAFFDTLNNLNRVGILPVGAGANLVEAVRPVVVEVNGIRFGILSLGQIEELAFANEFFPGVGVLTEQSLVEGIQATREIADVVIVMPHWGPEDVPMPNWQQLVLARVAVNAGADLVVGNHTHVVQAFEEIEGIPVFYGLGNFVFDQIWSRDHMQGVILTVRFNGTEIESYQMIATITEHNGRVTLASQEEAQEIFDRLERVNANLPKLPLVPVEE